MNIRLNLDGVIVSGDEMGRRVRIQDDRQNTGGFLILTWSQGAATDSIDGADAWVESRAQLESYIEEGGWIIEWTKENEERA